MESAGTAEHDDMLYFITRTEAFLRSFDGPGTALRAAHPSVRGFGAASEPRRTPSEGNFP